MLSTLATRARIAETVKGRYVEVPLYSLVAVVGLGSCDCNTNYVVTRFNERGRST
jgi:hypothetical protein